MTTVTSDPDRARRASPIGTVYSPSGTSSTERAFFAIQGSPMTPLWKMKTTGLSSRIADVISPFASAGVLGTTTFMPGRWAKVPHRHWECCAPSE